jgi:hypothetical protein
MLFANTLVNPMATRNARKAARIRGRAEVKRQRFPTNPKYHSLLPQVYVDLPHRILLLLRSATPTSAIHLYAMRLPLQSRLLSLL